MNIITREELKAKLDRGEPIKLVMALGEWAFRAKHIPGSLNFPSPQEAVKALDKNDEIVVYCSDRNCFASRAAYQTLEKAGYTRLSRYEGGLADWEAAGYPLEGEWVEAGGAGEPGDALA